MMVCHTKAQSLLVSQEELARPALCLRGPVEPYVLSEADLAQQTCARVRTYKL